MIFKRTNLKDAWLIEVERRGDERGYFARTMCRGEFSAHGLVTEYVQQNMSVSFKPGTLRGMHFQAPPFTEAKLVRCVRGAIFDVIVDLRGGSPTYMRHESFQMTSENHHQLYVPPGFAHGFQTLTKDVEVTYLVSEPYTPSAEGGIHYGDPLLAIEWPLEISELSARDAAWPVLDGNGPSLF